MFNDEKDYCRSKEYEGEEEVKADGVRKEEEQKKKMKEEDKLKK